MVIKKPSSTIQSSTGTTWLQEILYLVNNGADAEDAASRPLVQRIPFLDYVKMWPVIQQTKGPRILKTHLGSFPLSLSLSVCVYVHDV